MDVAFCCRGAVLEIRGMNVNVVEGFEFKKKAVLCRGKQAASEKLIIQKCEFWRLDFFPSVILSCLCNYPLLGNKML